MGNQTSCNKQYSTVQMTNNVFTRQLPHHRFTDYSKAQLNIDMIERRQRRNIGKNRTDEDLELAAIAIRAKGNIQEYQRKEFLIPPEKLMRPVAKHISFSKQKRPELWPVKDWHSRPPYQDDLNDCHRVNSLSWNKSVSYI